MNPKISLVVPVYNVEKYIAECLESLINQSFKDIEIICVDDCGSDRSVEIIESYAKRDPRIKIIRNKKNLSLFQARMQGVLAQSTDWTLFCDSDDFLEPSACEEFYNATQGDFDIISAGCYRYGGGGRKPLASYPRMIFECLEDYENYLYRQKDLHTHAWGRLIKKEALLRAYALLDYKDRLQFAEDALLNFALWNCCERFCFLDSLLYNYRANPQSILGRKDEANILSHIRDCDTITAKIKECAPKSHKKLTRIFLSFILTSRLSWRSLLPRTPLERFCDYLQMRMFIWKRSLRYRFGI